MGLIKSKAKCIVWPPSRWQMLNKSATFMDTSSGPELKNLQTGETLDLNAFDKRKAEKKSLIEQ